VAIFLQSFFLLLLLLNDSLFKIEKKRLRLFFKLLHDIFYLFFVKLI